MDADLFFDIPQLRDLDEAAVFFFDAIGACEYDERESSFYIDCCYFRAVVEGCQYKFAMSDDANARDLRFWIHVKNIDHFDNTDTFDSFVDRIATMYLKSKGARVIRLHCVWDEDSRVERYHVTSY